MLDKVSSFHGYLNNLCCIRRSNAKDEVTKTNGKYKYHLIERQIVKDIGGYLTSMNE